MKLTVMITSYVFIAAISILPRYIYPCPDPSLQETVGRNIFLEHRNFVLNVPISILLTTHDSTACALECLHRSQLCRSFNFAINPGSGNCKLLSTDKYKEEEEFRPSSFYNHYSITVSYFVLHKLSDAQPTIPTIPMLFTKYDIATHN